MANQRSPLYDLHDERGASFTEFGGWDMPVEFDSIRTEHEAVREDVGRFDVSHMGEIRVSGPDAAALTQRLVSNDVESLSVGATGYGTITDDSGHVIDDTIVYRLPDEDDEPVYMFVPNAGNDEAMYDRWVSHRDEWDLDATVENQTAEWAMFALQGPNARDLAEDVIEGSIRDLSRFHARTVTVEGVDTWTGRMGYTGEDGLEFMVPWDDAETVWSALECQACGLGARDTLRLEAGYPLAGNEFDQESNRRTPLEVGIDFAVALDTEFVGRDALVRQSEAGLDQRLVGFRLLERGVPRHGYEIVNEDEDEIGMVTSGTMSPSLDEPIGMGYVDTDYADPGTSVEISIRGRTKKANIETLPFVETIETK